jgi:hypothetical protein
MIPRRLPRFCFCIRIISYQSNVRSLLPRQPARLLLHVFQLTYTVISSRKRPHLNNDNTSIFSSSYFTVAVAHSAVTVPYNPPSTLLCSMADCSPRLRLSGGHNSVRRWATPEGRSLVDLPQTPSDRSASELSLIAGRAIAPRQHTVGSPTVHRLPRPGSKQCLSVPGSALRTWCEANQRGFARCPAGSRSLLLLGLHSQRREDRRTRE